MPDERVMPREDTEAIAVILHKINCHDNHADGCFWYYETSWDEQAHAHYLEKAARLVLAAVVRPDEIKYVLLETANALGRLGD